MNLLDRLKEFKNTTWDGLDVTEILNLPDEKGTAFMRRLSTPDLDSLIDEIADYRLRGDSPCIGRGGQENSQVTAY